MDIFGFLKEKPVLKASVPEEASTQPAGDVVERRNIQDGIQKGYNTNFLYKPPFGYPRMENIPQIRNFGKNGYIHAVVTSLQEEGANAEWELVPKDEEVGFSNSDDAVSMEIRDFLMNPNGNKEGWEEIVKKAIVDMCETGNGCWNKVFTESGEMTEIVALDGGAILKNPDIHGSIRNRIDIIIPTKLDSGERQLIGSSYGEQDPANDSLIRQYGYSFKETAAYFQYGWTVAALPVPFGRNEIVLFEKNPRTDTIYSRSPIAILADVIQTLVYGSLYNLDFYSNSNMPEGMLSMIGAQKPEIDAFKAKYENVFRKQDPLTGFMRRVGFKMPVSNRDVKFVPFNLSSREMQIIEQQKWFTKIVWMAFGLSSDDMGDTENSNKAVSESQFKKYTRKAVKPILRIIERRINQEIIPEFKNAENIVFKFKDYDLDEDLKRHELFKMQLEMGIKTRDMIAKEIGVDIQLLDEERNEDPTETSEPNDSDNNESNQGDNKSKIKSHVASRYRHKGRWIENKEAVIKASVSPDEKTLDTELVRDIIEKGKLVKSALAMLDQVTV